MAKKTNGTGRTLHVYRAYNFKDKDPVIDQLRGMVTDTYGKVNGKALRIIQESGGPSSTCMRAWFFGGTKRPVNPTVEAAGRAMGYRREWVPMRGKK